MANSKTKTIIFLERKVVPYPGKEDLVFEKGSVHELIDTSANRWIKRGAAVVLTEDELKEYRKASRSKPKTPAAGANDGNTVDGTKDVDGQNGGGDGERAGHDAGGSFLGRVFRRVFGSDQ